MVSSLSTLVHNHSNEIHKTKYGQEGQNVKIAELNWSILTAFLNAQTLKMIYQNTNVWFAIRLPKKFDEKLEKRFFKTCKFSNHNNNEFILFLRKGVYPYKRMNDWEKFNETSLPEKDF